jgi:citrate lyase beta subunit
MPAWLFVPGDRPERFEKAAAAGASVVILDLEDAVPPDRKGFARTAVRDALRAGFAACVRINAVGTPEGADDLVMLEATTPERVLLPKTSGPRDVDVVRHALPRTPVTALVESLDGVAHLDGIARAEGIEALAFGGYDLCAELGARPTPEVLAPWRAQLVFAVRRAGVAALDMPFVRIEDAAGLVEDCRRAVDFGFDGKLAIHPKQVGPIRGAFTPSAEEVARASAIVDAASGGGVVKVDGVMIDAPLLAAARRVLSRSGS